MAHKERKSKIRMGHDVQAPMTSPNRVPLPSTEDLIQKLPAELRNDIYELSLLADFENKCPAVKSRARQSIKSPARQSITPGSDWTEPGLLRTSKQIRREALPLYYKLNHVSIEAQTDNLGRVLNWLENLLQLCGRKLPFKSFTLVISQKHNAWEDVHLLLPLAEFFRKTGAIFAHPGVTKSGKMPPWIQKSDFTRVPTLMQAFIRQTGELGQKARAKGWSAKRLGKKYNKQADIKFGSESCRKYLKREQCKNKKKWDREKKDLERKLERLEQKLDFEKNRHQKLMKSKHERLVRNMAHLERAIDSMVPASQQHYSAPEEPQKTIAKVPKRQGGKMRYIPGQDVEDGNDDDDDDDDDESHLSLFSL